MNTALAPLVAAALACSLPPLLKPSRASWHQADRGAFRKELRRMGIRVAHGVRGRRRAAIVRLVGACVEATGVRLRYSRRRRHGARGSDRHRCRPPPTKSAGRMASDLPESCTAYWTSGRLHVVASMRSHLEA